MKRSCTRLIAKQSSASASVPLFQPENLATTSSTSATGTESPPRSTKRIKLENRHDHSVLNTTTALDDRHLETGRNDKVVAEDIKLELKDEEEEKPVKGKVRRRAATASSSPKKVKPIPQALAKPHPAPEKWKEQYEAIQRMRSRIVAPVDTMGCEQAQSKETDPKNQRFSTLVSLMLSSQTKDEVTDTAVRQLREAMGGSLTVDAVRKADDTIISEAICKVGFWRRKTQYLKKTAQVLHDNFDSDVPKTVDELCSLPGVGPKMAFLALQVAWNLNAGIGVDVHVHRITNRLKWHKLPTKNPEETRLNLQSWLPLDLHGKINHLLVGFGQTICLPVGPRCDLCDLNSKEVKLCPSAQKVTNAKNRKVLVLTEASDSVPSAGPKLEISIEDTESSASHS